MFATHKNLKKFTTDVKIADSKDANKSAETVIRYTEMQMRDKGFIPTLDVNSQRSLDRMEDGTFRLTISVYGVFMGKELAKKWKGIEYLNSGKLWPFPDTQPRPKP